MKLSSAFAVPGSPDTVLSLFLDPAIMQACVPGCEELSQVDDNRYQGTLVSEVAHVKFKAGFVADITERDIPSDTTKPAMIKAVFKGEDRRLGSTVKLAAALRVSPLTSGEPGDTSHVSYEMEMAMWGKLGRLGEAVIRRRTAEVEAQFAEALTAVCSGQPVPRRGPDARAVKTAKPTVAAAPRATDVDVAGQQADAERRLATVVEPDRRGEDWVVLGLAVAAAFAYGVIAGGRRRGTGR